MSASAWAVGQATLSLGTPPRRVGREVRAGRGAGGAVAGWGARLSASHWCCQRGGGAVNEEEGQGGGRSGSREPEIYLESLSC